MEWEWQRGREVDKSRAGKEMEVRVEYRKNRMARSLRAWRNAGPGALA